MVQLRGKNEGVLEEDGREEPKIVILMLFLGCLKEAKINDIINII